MLLHRIEDRSFILVLNTPQKSRRNLFRVGVEAVSVKTPNSVNIRKYYN